MTAFSNTFLEPEDHHPSQASARYKASFFGPFRVFLEQQPLGEPKWRRNKAKGLLKWFLLNPGDLFSVEQLSTLFWPHIPLKVATSNLHVTLHYLRHVLEPDLASTRPSTFVQRNRYNYYCFNLHDLWWLDLFDVHYLSSRARQAEQQAQLPRAVALYCQLLSYYRLTFLPEDIYEDVFSPYRRQHDLAYTQTLEHLMHLYIQINSFPDALSCALHTLSVDPYNEQAVTIMVRIYLQQGNTTAALCHLDEFASLLQQDLGIPVSSDLLTLRTTLLQSR